MKLSDLIPQRPPEQTGPDVDATDASPPSPDQVARELLDAGLDLEELQEQQKKLKQRERQRRNAEAHARMREQRQADARAQREEALQKTMDYAGIDDEFIADVIGRCEKAIEARPYDMDPPSPAAVANIAYHLADRNKIGKGDGPFTPEDVAKRWLENNVRQRITIRDGNREASVYH